MGGRERGQGSVKRRAWTEAYVQLSAADREGPLDPDDLERLATAAYLIGRDDEAVAIWARAHQELITRGHRERAVRSAFWLAFGLLHKGDDARGAGWIARARRHRGRVTEAGMGTLEVAGPDPLHAVGQKQIATLDTVAPALVEQRSCHQSRPLRSVGVLLEHHRLVAVKPVHVTERGVERRAAGR